MDLSLRGAFSHENVSVSEIDTKGRTVGYDMLHLGTIHCYASVF